MILPQNVVPIASAKVDAPASATIDAVNAALTTAELVGLNARSVTETVGLGRHRQDWLTQKGLLA